MKNTLDCLNLDQSLPASHLKEVRLVLNALLGKRSVFIDIIIMIIMIQLFTTFLSFRTKSFKKSRLQFFFSVSLSRIYSNSIKLFPQKEDISSRKEGRKVKESG